jgi:hypothetical protein
MWRWCSLAGVVLAACSRSELATLEPVEPVTLDCPADVSDPRLPRFEAGKASVIDATPFTGGPVASYRWEIVPEDCDAVLPSPANLVSGERTELLTFTPQRPALHRIRLAVGGALGQRASCEFEVAVEGRGLRVEACWDTSTTADLDLYVHSPRNQDNFFKSFDATNPYGLTPSTCNPANCSAELRFDALRTDFGYPDSPLADCETGPSPAAFAALGRCPNPRAGIDDNQMLASGVAEVAQIDAPFDGDTFRLMLHNFANRPAKKTAIFVYCSGTRVGSLLGPTTPPDFRAPDASTLVGLMWRAADVTAHSKNGQLTCSVKPLTLPGTTEPFVTVDDPSY